VQGSIEDALAPDIHWRLFMKRTLSTSLVLTPEPKTLNGVELRPAEPPQRGHAISWRWIAICVFVMSNALNYFDRQLLAAVAPYIKAEFHLTNAQYGGLVSAFSLVYAGMALVMGALVDRIGLMWTSISAVFMWSLSSLATGFSGSFRGLLLCRMGLGAGEAGALPCSGKAAAYYLPPSEWGLANAVGSICIALGSMAAPLVVAMLAPKYGWRSPFLLSGILGAGWILLWMLTAKKIRPGFEPRWTKARYQFRRVLRDGRLRGLALSYALVMTVFIFWSSWTTLYLVQERHLTAMQANHYFAWFPPIFGVFGGFISGGLAFRWIRAGINPISARSRICYLFAPVLLLSAAVPWIPSVALTVLAIAFCLLFSMSVVTSLNVIPVDLFGIKNAGFSTAVLACSYALMQTFLSPVIGKVIDLFGFQAVCVGLSIFPLAGMLVLRASLRSRPPLQEVTE
jgi:MFS transporter, ACS family, aldohexuronate transporter